MRREGRRDELSQVEVLNVKNIVTYYRMSLRVPHTTPHHIVQHHIRSNSTK